MLSRKKVICFSIILGLFMATFHIHMEHEHNILENEEPNSCIHCHNKAQLILVTIQVIPNQSWHMFESLFIEKQQFFSQYGWPRLETRAPPLMS